MKKWVTVLLAMVVVTSFLFGCTGYSKDVKVRCPKCGAVFTIEEGIAETQKKGW